MLLLVFPRRLVHALDEGEIKLPVVKIDVPGPDAKIRCPKCAYAPRADDRWYCDCGCCWNTFETRGLCPTCDRQWLETGCPACERWSRHEDWYEH